MKILLPSPHLKKIIDRTAQYTVNNGKEFQDKLKKKYYNSKIFKFLDSENIFHIYYLYKIKQNLIYLNNKYPKCEKNSTFKLSVIDMVLDISRLNLQSSNSFDHMIQLVSLFAAYNHNNVSKKLFNILINKHIIKNSGSVFFKKFVLLHAQYHYIVCNIQFITEVFKKLIFNKYRIYTCNQLKLMLTKYKQIFHISKTNSLKKLQDYYEWKTFYITETIDFFDYELNFLPEPVHRSNL
mmetsp:Transcript_23478/g.32771  ORF Transcript_23478/g.32771 Transcript_23478/m.32771 type:complete len:238 (-) Transcript_23478:1442-2155(-)